jgi:hypothetical protein
MLAYVTVQHLSFRGSSREDTGCSNKSPKGLIWLETRIQNDCTYPPLNAPTGFRDGNAAAASASLCEEVWKLRVARKAAEGEKARIAGDSMRDAIVVGVGVGVRGSSLSSSKKLVLR